MAALVQLGCQLVGSSDPANLVKRRVGRSELALEVAPADADAYALLPGDRMFIPCEGGPCRSRWERSPPPLEVEERQGLSVLVDDGPTEQWRYVFVPRT